MSDQADRERLTRTAVEALERVPAAYVSDCLTRLGMRDNAIKGVRCAATDLGTGGGCIVGPALTIELLPRRRVPGVVYDRVKYMEVLDEHARPGDVVVVAGHGAPYGFWGMHATLRAELRGAKAVIVDGGLRDGRELATAGIPVFGRGTSPEAYREHYEVNAALVPVVFSGMRISGGDLIALDQDGCVVVPADAIAAVVAELELVVEHERELEAAR